MWRFSGLLLLGACVLPELGGDAGLEVSAQTTALFVLPRAGVVSEYYSLPFPNDVHVRADGTLDLTGHAAKHPLVGEYLEVISTRFAGFGTNAAGFFRFSAPIDPATLPATPADSLQDGASVYLVDVDLASPERGARRPLRFRFDSHDGESIGPNWLGCLVYPGFPMRPATTYALVVTTRVRDEGGRPIDRDRDFAALVDDAAGDPIVDAARVRYAPLLAQLDEPGGDERADVVSAAVFTTQDPTALLGRMREVVRGEVAVPALAEVTAGPANEGFAVVTARYANPVFQTGEPPYDDDGEILVDAAGAPVVQRMEALRVAISVPPGAVPADGWPTVVYGHGTGGDYLSFTRDGTAGRFAAAGFAVIGFDQALNGARLPATATGGPELAFYNFLNPLAGRDNSRQAGADLFQLVRLVENAGFMAGGRAHRLDAGRLYYMGHSQGGITGPLGVAFEPAFRGAIFSGAGGLLYYALLLKTEPLDVPSLLGLFIHDFPLDEFNNVLALVQLFIEPADPINYARLVTREPPPGLVTRDVFQSQGFVDHYTPVPAIEALGVAFGGNPVAPLLAELPGFALAGRPTLEAPVVANLGERSVVFVQYPAAEGEDGHFVVFDDDRARRQHIDFIRSLDQAGAATLAP